MPVPYKLPFSLPLPLRGASARTPPPPLLHSMATRPRKGSGAGKKGTDAKSLELAAIPKATYAGGLRMRAVGFMSCPSPLPWSALPCDNAPLVHSPCHPRPATVTGLLEYGEPWFERGFGVEGRFPFVAVAVFLTGCWLWCRRPGPIPHGRRDLCQAHAQRHCHAAR